jgi:DNA-binding protein HU-beta
MNHKELIAEIAKKMNAPKSVVENLMGLTITAITDELIAEKTIGIQSFGNFEVRKKEERLSVHPSTQVRTLIPPKLVVNFKQSQVLKDKLKNLTRDE